MDKIADAQLEGAGGDGEIQPDVPSWPVQASGIKLSPVTLSSSRKTLASW
jgi:hypothetical protein